MSIECSVLPYSNLMDPWWCVRILHWGFHRGTSTLQAASGPALPLEETQIPINWQWFLRHALICLVGWLLLFAMLFLVAYYMQEDISPFVEH
jgi:hypothetical protein